MSPLISQLMQQLAFSGGVSPDPSDPFNGLLAPGVNEMGQSLGPGAAKQTPPFRVAGPFQPSLAEMPSVQFSVPPEQLPPVPQRDADLRAIENEPNLVRRQQMMKSYHEKWYGGDRSVVPTPAPSPSDRATAEVEAIARKLFGLPTRDSERIAAQSQARQNVRDERDAINARLSQRNMVAMSPLESQLTAATQGPAATGRVKYSKPKTANDRINDILPETAGAEVRVKGASGNGNRLVRLSDGTAMMMGPDAYRAYKTAMADGMDEKTAMRATQRDASERSAIAQAPGRARELVRTKGASALMAKKGLRDAIPQDEVADIAMSRAVKQGEAAANLKAQQERANPMLAMLRNDGSDSPIAQMFAYRQMGASPEDALRAYMQSQTLKQQGDAAKEENSLRRQTLDQQAADTKERSKAAQMRAELEFIQGVADPMKRRALEESFAKRYGLSPADSVMADSQQMPVVNPTSPPVANANNLAAAVKAGNKTKEQAIAEAEAADREIPFDPKKPRVKIADILRDKLALKEWHDSPAGSNELWGNAFSGLRGPKF